MENTQKDDLILGLDASSTMIGACIMNIDTEEILQMTYLDLSDVDITKDKVIECGVKFDKWLKGILLEFPNIKVCAIERAFVAMFGQQSSAHTTALLNQVNSVYRWIAHSHGTDVSAISVSVARKIAFPSLKLQSKAKAKMGQKEQVFAYVVTELGDKWFPTKILSKGKNKGNLVFEEYCKDMADAYVVAKSAIALRKLSKVNSETKLEKTKSERNL